MVHPLLLFGMIVVYLPTKEHMMCLKFWHCDGWDVLWTVTLHFFVFVCTSTLHVSCWLLCFGSCHLVNVVIKLTSVLFQIWCVATDFACMSHVIMSKRRIIFYVWFRICDTVCRNLICIPNLISNQYSLPHGVRVKNSNKTKPKNWSPEAKMVF